MKNTIKYYYEFENITILKYSKQIYVKSNNEVYIFSKVNNIKETIEIYSLTSNVKGIYSFILNKEKSIFTPYNNDNFVLLKIPSKKTQPKIGLINIPTGKYELDRTNWYELWTKKNDYFEYQSKHLKKNNYSISESLNYYLGMAENAISYIYNSEVEKGESIESKKICHRRIEKDNYLNPLFFVIDYKERELSEYLKYLFLNNQYRNVNIASIIKKFNCTKNGYTRLFARMIYPSFYFDQYEQILNENENDSKIIEIIKRNDEYEAYLKKIHSIINQLEHIKKIDWL